MDLRSGIPPIGYFDNDPSELEALHHSNYVPTVVAMADTDLISHPNLVKGMDNFLGVAIAYTEPMYYTGNITQVYRQSSVGTGSPKYPQGSQVDAQLYGNIAEIQAALMGAP